MMTDESRAKILTRITVDPAVLVGKPVIRGMRISVAQIIAAVAAGVPQSELLEDFPGLEPEDIQAALLYAADLVELKNHASALQGRFSVFENHRLRIR